MRARKQITINNINYIVLDSWFCSGAFSTWDGKDKYFARIQNPEKVWETRNIEVTKEQAKGL